VTHVPFTYDSALVTKLSPVPLHAGAERCYRGTERSTNSVGSLSLLEQAWGGGKQAFEISQNRL